MDEKYNIYHSHRSPTHKEVLSFLFGVVSGSFQFVAICSGSFCFLQTTTFHKIF